MKASRRLRLGCDCFNTKVQSYPRLKCSASAMEFVPRHSVPRTAFWSIQRESQGSCPNSEGSWTCRIGHISSHAIEFPTSLLTACLVSLASLALLYFAGMALFSLTLPPIPSSISYVGPMHSAPGPGKDLKKCWEHGYLKALGRSLGRECTYREDDLNASRFSMLPSFRHTFPAIRHGSPLHSLLRCLQRAVAFRRRGSFPHRPHRRSDIPRATP